MREVQSKPRNAVIDLIRGACILYIVGCWHLFNYTKAFPEHLNPVTHRLLIITLGLFTLLSGYLNGMKEIRPDVKDIGNFYRDRLLRIYPPFLFAILLFYGLRISDGITLFKSAALISMFFAPAPPTLWFVTMIILFYITTPLLIHASRSTTKYIVLCVLIIAVALTCAHLFKTVDIRILIYLPAFATGVLIAKHRRSQRNINLKIIALLFAASVAISCNNVAPLEHNMLSMPLALFGPLFVYLVAIRMEKVVGHHNSITFLSYASFFMYLFHRPIFEVLRHLYFPASAASQLLYLFAICLPSIVVISWLAQKAYDKLIIRLTSGWRRLPGGAGHTE